MKIYIFIAFFLSCFNLSARKIEQDEISTGFGFGRQFNRSFPKQTIDGKHFRLESDYVKSFNVGVSRYINKKNFISMELGFSYNYHVNYTVTTQSNGLSIGVDAGSNSYSVLQGLIYYNRSLKHSRQFNLFYYGGMGVCYPFEDHFKSETLDRHVNPFKPIKYYHQPSVVYSKPIPVLSGGLLLKYQLKKAVFMFANINGRYAFKPFLVDIVRVEHNNHSTILESEITGSNIILSGGVSVKI